MILTTTTSHFLLSSIKQVNHVSASSSTPGPGFVQNIPGFYGTDRQGYLSVIAPNTNYGSISAHAAIYSGKKGIAAVSNYFIYDEYNGIAPSKGLSNNLYYNPRKGPLTMHSFSVSKISNSFSLFGFNSFKAFRKRDVSGGSVFNKNPNFLFDEFNHSIFSLNGFRTGIIKFLLANYPYSSLPDSFSVRLFISWGKWVEIYRKAPPCFCGDGSLYAMRNYALGNPQGSADLGIAYLHSVYLYK